MLDLLKQLYSQYGDKLVEEIAYLIEQNGQGDCYKVLCSEYCFCGSCTEAIKSVVKDYLTGGKDAV